MSCAPSTPIRFLETTRISDISETRSWDRFATTTPICPQLGGDVQGAPFPPPARPPSRGAVCPGHRRLADWHRTSLQSLRQC